MKIRIGTILGIDGDSDPGPFNEAVRAMEALGFDSLWLAELISRGTPDPIVGLAHAGRVGQAAALARPAVHRAAARRLRARAARPRRAGRFPPSRGADPGPGL